MKYIVNFFLVSVLVYYIVPVSAQTPCELPDSYLDDVAADISAYGAELGSVNTADAAQVADFYIELYEVRQGYADMTTQLPVCGLRLHALLIGLLADMQDLVGLAMAAQLNPDNVDLYVEKIDLLNERLLTLEPLIQDEVARLSVDEEVLVLATRYVAMEALNVRTGPGSQYESIGVLLRGTPVEIIALDLDAAGDTWYKIYFEDTTGWVFGNFTSANP